MVQQNNLNFKSEVLPTYTERGFISILGTFCTQLGKYDLQPIDTIEGKSITPLSTGIDKPFMKGFFKPFKMAKCDKVSLANCILMDKILVSALIIIPDDNHDLPILTLEWSETEKTVSLVADLIPLVDLVMNDDYQARYLDALAERWVNYQKLSGMAPNRFAWVRMMFSPYYLSGSTAKQDEAAVRSYIEVVHFYLAHWFSLWEKAQPIHDHGTKHAIQKRKSKIRRIFRENDEGAKTMSQMVGKDIVEMLLLCNF